MTERQIEQLKKVLADSNLADNSTELDDLILKSAYQSAQLTRLKADSEHRWTSFKLIGLLPFSFLRSASLAIVFTAGAFLTMGQLVSVDEDNAAVNGAEIQVDKVVSNPPLKAPNQGSIERPKNVAIEPVPGSWTRDQILRGFELSDTEALVAELSFEFSHDPELSQNNIAVAMVDISSLIRTGELMHARQRYSDLKMQCDRCGLPDTLEALVLASQQLNIKDSPSETG